MYLLPLVIIYYNLLLQSPSCYTLKITLLISLYFIRPRIFKMKFFFEQKLLEGLCKMWHFCEGYESQSGAKAPTRIHSCLDL